MTTWVLVANSTKARIFERAGAKLQQMEALYPAPRNSELEVASPTRDETTASTFALRVAAHLERVCQRRGVRRLVLVGDREFLGLLRMWLTRRVAELVVVSIREDFAPVRDAELPTALERTVVDLALAVA